MTQFDVEGQIWRECEVAWQRKLQAEGWLVVPLTEATGNVGGTKSPMAHIGGQHIRTPDLQATKSGTTVNWEIKYRSRPSVDPMTAELEHWTSFDAFRDYITWTRSSGQPLYVALFEDSPDTSPGRWMIAEVKRLLQDGRQGEKTTSSGELVRAWIWPASSMEVVDGPDVTLGVARPLLPAEGTKLPIDPDLLSPFERDLRGRGNVSKPREADGQKLEIVLEHMMDDDPRVGLELLARKLNLPGVPCYSVLCIAPSQGLIEDLLGFLDYGIRVFLITHAKQVPRQSNQRLNACSEARLLEWATLGDLDVETTWFVDGAGLDASAKAIIERADKSGGLNSHQFEIVHAPADQDVAVIAGAGTGKTETMAERILFLLSTYRDTEFTAQGSQSGGISLRDFVLITFTREAAREMAARLTRSITWRRRLASRCVHPVVGWLLQLSQMKITTIHGFCSQLLRATGSEIGLSPSFTVSQRTMDFRRVVRQVSSNPIERLFEKGGAGKVPAEHDWLKHIEQLWATLENNGIDLSDERWSATRERLSLLGGSDGSDSIPSAVDSILRGTAASFAPLMIRSQAVSPNRLVPMALKALQQASDLRPVRAKFIFVDEFQDSDTTQIDLVLALRERLGASLYVVGDPKQGVYRFRGAEGDAFHELRDRAGSQPQGPFQEYRLTMNFRTDEVLLNSLDGIFGTLGRRSLLEYKQPDRLLPDPKRRGGQPISFETASNSEQARDMALNSVVELRDRHPRSSIALICRTNRQALMLRKHLVDNEVPCEILVGGQFFQSPAVVEARVLLEALCNTDDAAALVELLETRWARGILEVDAPFSELGAPHQGDRALIDEHSFLSWNERIAGLGVGGTFPISDLEVLGERVRSISSGAQKIPVAGLLALLAEAYTPASTTLASDIPGDDTDRRRYARCLSHLLMRISLDFSEGPLTLHGLLGWLRLQVAINHDEDEPMAKEELVGRITALTVHKSKGQEFDHVLVPFTQSPFTSSDMIRSTESAVVRSQSGQVQLLWRWNSGGTTYEVGGAHQWQQEEQQVRSEEARLLYVALTRARHSLEVFLASFGHDVDRPNSWGSLIALSGGR